MRITLFIAFVALSTLSFSQPPTNVLHFKGRLFEIELKNNNENILKTGTVKVYQDKSLYVFLEASRFGSFDFLLPLGHVYTLEFSGENLISKNIELDARKCPDTVEKTSIDFDVVLFKRTPGVQFKSLLSPIAKYTWDPQLRVLINDDDYSFDQTKALKKEVRKAKRNITLAEK